MIMFKICLSFFIVLVFGGCVPIGASYVVKSQKVNSNKTKLLHSGGRFANIDPLNTNKTSENLKLSVILMKLADAKATGNIVDIKKYETMRKVNIHNSSRKFVDDMFGAIGLYRKNK